MRVSPKAEALLKSLPPLVTQNLATRLESAKQKERCADTKFSLFSEIGQTWL